MTIKSINTKAPIRLYCKKIVQKDPEFFDGREYKVIQVRPDSVWLMNEYNAQQAFSLDPQRDDYYGNYFAEIPELEYEFTRSMKTVDEWANHNGLIMVDYKGFDWVPDKDMLISETQFRDGLVLCTVRYKAGGGRF